MIQHKKRPMIIAITNRFKKNLVDLAYMLRGCSSCSVTTSKLSYQHQKSFSLAFCNLGFPRKG